MSRVGQLAAQVLSGRLRAAAEERWAGPEAENRIRNARALILTTLEQWERSGIFPALGALHPSSETPYFTVWPSLLPWISELELRASYQSGASTGYPYITLHMFSSNRLAQALELQEGCDISSTGEVSYVTSELRFGDEEVLSLQEGYARFSLRLSGFGRDVANAIATSLQAHLHAPGALLYPRLVAGGTGALTAIETVRAITDEVLARWVGDHQLPHQQYVDVDCLVWFTPETNTLTILASLETSEGLRNLGPSQYVDSYTPASVPSREILSPPGRALDLRPVEENES